MTENIENNDPESVCTDNPEVSTHEQESYTEIGPRLWSNIKRLKIKLKKWKWELFWIGIITILAAILAPTLEYALVRLIV